MRVGQVIRFIYPSALAAAVATLVMGAAEAYWHAPGALGGAAQIGIVALVAFPFGLLAALAVRGLWRSWQTLDVADDTGAAPRLLAWIVTCVAGAVLCSAGVFKVVRMAARRKFEPSLVALLASVSLLCLLVIIVALSRPVAHLLTRGLRRADRAVHRRWNVTPLRPRWVLAGCGAILAVVGAIEWQVAVLPRMGTWNPWTFAYPLAFVIVLALAHVAYAPLARQGRTAVRARRGAGAALFAVLAVCVAVGVYVRMARIPLLLDLWAQAPISGEVAELIYDPVRLGARLAASKRVPVERPGAPHPDIVLITIDTVRADHTPMYAGLAKMPALQGLARDGVVFEWAFSAGAVTRRSVPSLLTGLWPRRVHGRAVDWALKVDPRHTMLAERLRAGGYQTAAFVCCEKQFGPDSGLTRGFDEVVIDPSGGKLSAAAKRWLDARPPGGRAPYFIWIHYYEPHEFEKLYSRDEHGAARPPRYDLALAAVDKAIGVVLAEVRAPARRESTVVVVTSDHGQGLGDHKIVYHGYSLYNSEIRVPLVVAGPGIPAGRVQPPVSLVDLAPTLLELAGYELPELGMDGDSLRPLLSAPGNPIDGGRAFSFLMKDRRSKTEMDATISGRYKLIRGEDTRAALYDYVADPKEERNLAASHPDVRRRLDALRKERQRRDALPPF